MNAGLPDPVSVGVVFIGVGLSESVMRCFLTVMQSLAGRE
jgi:hypothetical protein